MEKNIKLSKFKDATAELKAVIDELAQLTYELKNNMRGIYRLEELINLAGCIESKVQTIEKEFIKEFRTMDFSKLEVADNINKEIE